MKLVFKTNVLWSSANELGQKNQFDQIAAQFSGTAPIHNHQGELRMTDNQIFIEGDTMLTINLNDIVQIYHGFDELYKPNFIKNLGLFCQPLRIQYNERYSDYTVYLIVGYSFFGCADGKTLFNILLDRLS